MSNQMNGQTNGQINGRINGQINWMRRKFLQVSSLFTTGWFLDRAATAQHQHEQHQPSGASGAVGTPQGGKGQTGRDPAPERSGQKPKGTPAKPSGGGMVP